MYSTRIKTPVITLAVLCAAATLTLLAPNTLPAERHLPMAETSQAASVVCPEPHRPALAWQPSEERVRVELQVPEALVRALLTEARAGGTVALHGPEVLLGSLYAEGRVQRLQKRQERCGPFFSLY